MRALKRFYAEQEEFIEMLRRHSTCSPNCCYCCYTMTRFSVAEAVLMIGAYTIDESDLYIHLDRLKQVKGDLEKWLELRIPCLFLRDGVCQCYEVRPWICRSYFVTSPVAACAAGGEVRVLNVTSRNKEYEEMIRALSTELGLPYGAIPQPLAIKWALAYKRLGVEAMLLEVREDVRNDTK